MRKVKFIFDSWEQIKEYPDDVKDKELDHDYELWKQDIITQNYDFYWIDYVEN